MCPNEPLGPVPLPRAGAGTGDFLWGTSRGPAHSSTARRRFAARKRCTGRLASTGLSGQTPSEGFEYGIRLCRCSAAGGGCFPGKQWVHVAAVAATSTPHAVGARARARAAAPGAGVSASSIGGSMARRCSARVSRRSCVRGCVGRVVGRVRTARRGSRALGALKRHRLRAGASSCPSRRGQGPPAA